MKKITRITTQKKNKHRYNIFLQDGTEEKFAFGVDEDVFVQYHLHKGMELSEAMVENLLEADTLQKSYAQVLGYLSYRMRTKKEIYDYLVKKEVDQEHITQVIEKLIVNELIDDQEFAHSFVRSRIQTTTKGPGLVKQELIAKGITVSIADEAVEQYGYGVQYEKALKLAEKRSKKSSRHSIKKQQQQLQVILTRNGFTQDVINDILTDIQIEDTQGEWEALCFQGEKLLKKHQGKLSGYELKNKVTESLYRQGFQINSIYEFLDKQIDETLL